MSAENFSPSAPEQLAKANSLRDELPVEGLNGGSVQIDTNAASIYGPAEIGLPASGYYSVMGEVRVVDDGTKAVAIVRERRDGKETFYAQGLEQDEQGKIQRNGHGLELQPGVEITLGREADYYPWNSIDPTISRKQVKLSLFGGSIHIQDTSSNGTDVVGAQTNKKLVEVNNNHILEHTERAETLLLKLNTESKITEVDGETYIDGRVSVGRDTVINAERPAIDIRSWIGDGESIVIDSKKYPEQYEKLTASYEAKLKTLGRRKLRRKTEEMKLRAVYETVSEAMEYDLGYVEQWEKVVVQKPKEKMRKVSLDTYLEYGKGVCRHMALAVAWLGGELARKGELQGRTTAGVSQRERDNTAHEWARYTAADGTVYIIDPAQKKFGKLVDFIDDKKAWEYFRPGERSKYDALLGRGDVDPAHVVLGAGKVIKRIYK